MGFQSFFRSKFHSTSKFSCKQKKDRIANREITMKWRNPIEWYANKLETDPIRTKCLTSGMISGSGDLVCQYIDFQNKKIDDGKSGEKDFLPDMARTGRFVLLGSVLVAPVVHVWYGMIMRRFPGTSLQAVFKRTATDQFFFAPMFLPTFMLNLMILEGRPLSEILEKLKNDMPETLLANWALWIPAMFLNFRFIPIKWQVLFSNFVGFVWNIYLSWKVHE